MTTVSDHYEALLAEHYTWMFGDFDARVAAERELLARLGFDDGSNPVKRRRALDLGCGLGFQSLAMADLGWQVVAVGASARLLDEMRHRIADRPVETLRADLTALPIPDGQTFDAVLCMEDTLSHLPDRTMVTDLLGRTHDALAPGGRLVVTFRDRGTALSGLDRFVPVRGDVDKVMTSFLEYEAETVMVYNLVSVRDETGWTLSKSCHRKLRLSPDWVSEALRAAGFEIIGAEPAAQLLAIVARRQLE